MLSGETAAGQYPEEAVKTMRNIAISAEAAQDYKKLSDRTKLVETSLVNAIVCVCSTYCSKFKC